MLAKVLSMQGEYINQAHQAISLISTDHTAELDALGFNINTRVQEVGTLSQKMSVLISLLRHSIRQDPLATGEVSEEAISTS